MLALLDELQKNPERFMRTNAPMGEVMAVEIPEPTASRTVFLIHGHDELNLLATAAVAEGPLGSGFHRPEGKSRERQNAYRKIRGGSSRSLVRNRTAQPR